MNYYQIADLEKLSGIKAHTIRIWEKRYNLIEPYRSETNIRYYDDAQLKKILNISSLITKGYKISKIANLSEDDITALISQNIDNNIDSTLLDFINNLITSMLSFNQATIEKTCSSAITRFGMHDAMLLVFYPFLNKIGVLWSISTTLPVQEHFASNLIKQKIIAAIDGLPSPLHKNHRFLLFLPANEWHEIGLLFSNYIIRQKGFQTIYLGQNLPLNEIEIAINATHPTHIFTNVYTNMGVDFFEQKSLLKLLKSKNIKLLVSGNLVVINQYSSNKQINILKTPTDLLKILEEK